MPTDTIAISSAANDGTGYRGPAATWAGIGAASYTDNSDNAGNTLDVGKSGVGAQFYADNSYLRFDMASIDSGAVVSAVNLLLNPQDIVNNDDFALAGDYLDFGGEPSVAGDWTETASPSIFTAVDIDDFTVDVVESIPLTDITDVQDAVTAGAYVGIRLTYDAGTPTGATLNYISFAAFEHADQEPRLEVTWELSGQQIRPDADIATTGWATAPLWSKIDEETPDGTVITATAS